MAVEAGVGLKAVGLCGDRSDHAPHWVKSAPISMAGYWCHADQTKRMPFAGERWMKVRRASS